MKNLAIIGCGALGKILARNLSRAVPNSYYILRDGQNEGPCPSVG